LLLPCRIIKNGCQVPTDTAVERQLHISFRDVFQQPSTIALRVEQRAN